MASSSLMTQTPRISIQIDNCSLSQVETSNFLGVVIDSKLKFKEHVHEVITKICKLIGVLYKIRNNITPECLRTIYQSLAYPRFLYGAAIWGGTFDTYLDDLFIIQKLLRVMSSSHRHAHTDLLFRRFKLLKLSDIIVYLSKHIFSCINH